MTSVTENKTDMYSAVEQSDPETYEILMAEGRRQANCLELIASENHVSRAVLQTVPISVIFLMGTCVLAFNERGVEYA